MSALEHTPSVVHRSATLETPPIRGRWVVANSPWREPEHIFAALYGDASDAFWLDSSRAEAGLSRFSYMGACDGPHARTIRYDLASQCVTVTHHGVTTTERSDIFAFLRREIARSCVAAPDVPFDFAGGFVGYLGYELKAACGGQSVHASPYPDACLLFADRMIVFDHREQTIALVGLAVDGDGDHATRWLQETQQRINDAPALVPLDAPVHDPADLDVRIHLPHDAYLDRIAACKAALTAGESYEICLTTQLSVETAVDPFVLYRHLRRVNPAPYAAFMRCGDMAVLSSSPERFLKVDRERQVEAKPIKGTARRGTTPQTDRAIVAALQRDEKTRAENLMIVDLLRNDLGMVCTIGSVHVPKLMDIETYATLHQVVSTVRGTLRADVDTLDCVRAAFPAGSMTGAPKLRTMELIDTMEGEARSVYAGALGWFGLDGRADLSVVIRTMVWTDDRVTLGAGGAITVQSDPEAEWEEMMLKTEPLLRALATTITHPEAPCKTR